MRILLVEDGPSAAQMLAKGLREQSYAVDVATDGEAAVYQAGINDYDLVILDVMFPLKDGSAPRSTNCWPASTRRSICSGSL